MALTTLTTIGLFMKKERPILFNGEMVRAILDGRKTQTRRIVNPQPVMASGVWGGPYLKAPEGHSKDITCPFGDVGDRLYVRETFCVSTGDDGSVIPYYKADGMHGEKFRGWKPSIHMPRWASRITLEVTGVRIERLRDISEEDAKAEGMFFTDYGRFCFHENKPLKETDCPAPDDTHPLLEGWSWGPTKSHKECLGTARGAFANLWSQVYGSASWYENPWVWVVEFRRLGAQEKAA